jgi:uncharacterized repeat protein (TIGR03803 family)
MNSFKTGPSWVFLFVCVAVLAAFISTPHDTALAQCTRNCGLPPGSSVTLYSFTGPPDGMNPQAELIEDTGGNFYGTTSQGGVTAGACASLGCGIVFKLDTSGTETVLHTFTGTPDGANPVAGLVEDASGNLYGTTSNGGVSNFGTVFKLDSTGNETVLYSFMGAPADGAAPAAGLILGASGDLYGTTSQGGASSDGTVFQLDTTGKETILHSFLGAPADGANPMAGLVLDAAGNLYGTTFEGGAGPCSLNSHYRFDTPSTCGTVFKLNPTGTESVLHNFTGDSDGANPAAALVQDATGNFYGTTAAGAKLCYTISSLPPTAPTGIYCGTVFKLDTTGTESVLYSFTGEPDGAIPDASLILDAAGNLYGTTSEGGSGTCDVSGGNPGSPGTNLGCGSVFKLNTAGQNSVLYSFTGTGLDWAPHAKLTLDAVGNLYGTTSQGGVTAGACGNFGCGVIFELVSAVTPPDFSLAPVSSTLTTQPGGQVTDVITVATQNGSFTSAVQLTCSVTGTSPLPTCGLSPTSVTPGANSATSTLTIAAPSTSSMLATPGQRQFYRSFSANLLPLAFALFAITLIAGSKKVRRHSSLLCAFLLLLTLLQIGCGGGGGGSTQTPMNYTVTVTGAANSGALTHTTQITLTVQ